MSMIAYRLLRKCLLGSTIVCFLGMTDPASTQEVTADRLRNADNEPENWLVYGGTYRSLRYSQLDQVNVNNVHTLKAAWAFQAGVIAHGLQSTPLVADGIMYLATSGHRILRARCDEWPGDLELHI